MKQPPKLLTIGGTDPCGAYGLFVDLKTFTALGVYGMGVVAVVTAQNSQQFSLASFSSPSLVQAQITAVLSDYGADGIKTGFLGRVDLIEAIAETLTSYTNPLVVDPVLVDGDGSPLFPPAVLSAYASHLFPRATVITPNLGEARLLLGAEVQDGPSAAEAIAQKYGVAVLLKGVKKEGQSVDYWANGREVIPFPQVYLPTRHTAGSGDTLSAALVTYLAQGKLPEEAIVLAQQFTHHALAAAQHWQMNHGEGPLNHLGNTPYINKAI